MNQTSEANEPNLVHEDSPAESVERKFFVANLGELKKGKDGPSQTLNWIRFNSLSHAYSSTR